MNSQSRPCPSPTPRRRAACAAASAPLGAHTLALSVGAIKTTTHAPPRNQPPVTSHVEDPVRKICPVSPDRPDRPDLAQSRHCARSHLVQRRPSRRQPGAHRADEFGAQAPYVRAAGEARLQGNRSRLSGRLADRFRLRPRAHRRQPDPGGCDHPGTHPGAPGDHRTHLPGARWRPARHRACLQFHLHHPAPRSLQAGSRGHPGHRGARRRVRAPRSRAPPRHRVDPSNTAPRASRPPNWTMRWRSAMP